MKRNIDATSVVTTLACLVPIAFGAAVYGELPARMATHFDMSGAANGWMAKPVVVFGMPLFFAAMNAVLIFSLAFDPKRKNISAAFKTAIKWLMPIMSVVIQGATILIALGNDIDISTIVLAFVGVVFVICGNYLPKSRRNYTVGIKLPWTLDNDDNWNRTHRLAGFLWVIGGLAMIAAAFTPHPAVRTALVAIPFVLALVPTVYSFVLYRRGKEEGDENRGA